MIEVRIFNEPGFENPKYATTASAGVDLIAKISEPLTMKSLGRAMVPTGIYLEIPEGYEGQVRPRSGMAAKRGIGVLNSPGTIDADYRGEVKVILVNLSDETVVIEPRERIAQLVFSKIEQAKFINVESSEDLSETVRGAGGFGSTGTK
jgi:dUTP pyrophosphatase